MLDNQRLSEIDGEVYQKIQKITTTDATTCGSQVSHEVVKEVQSAPDISTLHRKKEKNIEILYSKEKTELKTSRYIHVFFNFGSCTAIFA